MAINQRYSLKLILEQDGIEVNITNESVDCKKLNDEAIIRPRHITLIDELIRIIKERAK